MSDLQKLNGFRTVVIGNPSQHRDIDKFNNICGPWVSNGNDLKSFVVGGFLSAVNCLNCDLADSFDFTEAHNSSAQSEKQLNPGSDIFLFSSLFTSRLCEPKFINNPISRLYASR